MDESMNFDDVLGIVGGMGTFQWCILIVYSVASAWSVESIYSNFIGKYIVSLFMLRSVYLKNNFDHTANLTEHNREKWLILVHHFS